MKRRAFIKWVGMNENVDYKEVLNCSNVMEVESFQNYLFNPLKTKRICFI
jgi:hypothetical protein